MNLTFTQGLATEGVVGKPQNGLTAGTIGLGDWQGEPVLVVEVEPDHHPTDDILKRGVMRNENGGFALPKGPGLGLDPYPDKVAQCAEVFRRHGGYACDRGPARPGCY